MKTDSTLNLEHIHMTLELPTLSMTYGHKRIWSVGSSGTFFCSVAQGQSRKCLFSYLIRWADAAHHGKSLSGADVTNARAEEVSLGRFCYVGLDHRTGQPVSPSCQGRSFLSPPDSAAHICAELAS